MALGSSEFGPIVLVHGAWVGAWTWEPVLPLLHASGRPVHAVALRGLGSRAGESSPSITLADHVADVLAVLESNDLTDVTLVGHSYGGRVVSRAWEAAPERISRLVYLDAHAPLEPARTAVRSPADFGDDLMIPFTGFDPDPALVGGLEALATFLARAVPHPALTLTERFLVDLPASLPKVYVAATEEPDQRFRAYAAVARANESWTVVDLASTHWLMYSHATEVASVILGNDA